MEPKKISLDTLISIVENGGTVRTGVDIFSASDNLLLEKDVPVTSPAILIKIKQSGIREVPLSPEEGGGLWDRGGKPIAPGTPPRKRAEVFLKKRSPDVEKKIKQIQALKKEADQKYRAAKQAIKKVLAEIKQTGGEFNYEIIEHIVLDLFDFVTRHENAFSYLTKEIFSYDDYLYNHSINVCTIATAVMARFNETFCGEGKGALSDQAGVPKRTDLAGKKYLASDLQNISLGYFLHDVGKVLVPPHIINKEGPLNRQEFNEVKTHSFEKGLVILRKNNLHNTFITNIVRYHHSALYKGEANCYPEDRLYYEIPPYVKICKFVDIYDAMTSRRCYKEALNPIVVVTELYNTYANKESLVQFLLHAFVKTVGIYPPGSIVFLNNGQLAYVVDSEGPLVLPFTGSDGKTLEGAPDPINLAEADTPAEIHINRDRAIPSPKEILKRLPDYLK